MNKTALWNREAAQRDFDLMRYYLEWPAPAPGQEKLPWQWISRKQRQEALANERWPRTRWPDPPESPQGRL